jgi:hypothetical protein
MKKKRKTPDPPKDFEVDDADAAFLKMENAARHIFSAPKPKRRPLKRKKAK